MVLATVTALHHGKPATSDAERQQRALSGATRISLQDVADIAERFFGRDPLPSGLKDGNALGASKGDSLTALYNLLKDARELLTKAEQLQPASAQA